MIILDTNALITFLERDRNNSSEYLNLVAGLGQMLDQPIALPMPVVSEFIAGDQNDERTIELIRSDSKFKKLDFDIKSGLMAARIYKDYRNHLKVTLQSQRPNQKVKIDIQILGIALANNADYLVTRDKEIKKIVEALNLNMIVFDYGEEGYFEQMTGRIVNEATSIQ